MRIGVLGLNYKTADICLREEFAKACLHLLQTPTITYNLGAYVLLSTCNRTEIYFASKDTSASHSLLLQLLRLHLDEQMLQKLYSFFGVDCFRHLIRVTAGLDSAIAAETEIQGQVRRCYEAAQSERALPPELHYLFQRTLQSAKKLRNSLPCQGLPNLEQVIYSLCLHDQECLSKTPILLVGASRTNLSLGNYLLQKGVTDITLINRSPVSSKFNTLPWSHLHTWTQFQTIICATKAPHFLLLPEHIQTPKELFGKQLIDLSMPRNIHPSLKELCPLYQIDELQHQLHIRNHQLSSALENSEKLAELRAKCLAAQWLLRSEAEPGAVNY